MIPSSNKNQLPPGWKWQKFGDVVNNLDGKRRPLSKEVRVKRKGDYRYYGATEIVDYIDDYIFEGEHLLVGEDGANLLSKSKALAFIVDGKFWVNNHAHVLQAKATFVNKYLCYYFNSLNLAKFVTGTAQPKLTQGNLNKIEIPICSPKIQLAIVSKIEELFSEIDKGIENLRTAQQQLKTYRQSVLKWAFEGKLTNENVKEGVFPKGWKMKSIGDIFEVYIGSTPKRNVPEYWGGDINWVSSGEIAFCNIMSTKEKITQEGLEKTSCKVHPIGTVIIAMIGEGKTRGQAAILKIEASHNQNTAAIRVDNNIYKSELLYYYLVFKYEDNRKVGSGNNQKALNKERVKSIPIPFPSIKEQNRIVQEIESRLSVADKMEESITQSLQQAEALRQSILKKAFEGRL